MTSENPLSKLKSGTLQKRDELDILVIKHDLFSAEIALQGAQLLSFKPAASQQDWLWLSPLASFQKHQAIRGGIPICLPWFGVNQAQPEKPKHGFVRNQLWQIDNITEDKHGIQVEFSFAYTGQAMKPELFDTAFIASLKIHLGEHIRYQLTLENTSIQAAKFSFAFHSYFKIDDLLATKVTGLNAKPFLDNTAGLQTKVLHGDISFEQEVDSVFEGCSQAQQLIAPAHRLRISASKCPSCIVWNPQQALAANMPDVLAHYQDFVCIERGNAFADSLELAAGESFSGEMLIEQY